MDCISLQFLTIFSICLKRKCKHGLEDGFGRRDVGKFSGGPVPLNIFFLSSLRSIFPSYIKITEIVI